MTDNFEPHPVPYKEPEKTTRPKMCPSPELMELLQKHFPQAAKDALQNASIGLGSHHSVAHAFQLIERKERSSGADLDALRAAAKKLEDAETALEKVGLWGGALLLPLACQLDSFEADQFKDYSRADHQSTEFIVSHIREIRESILGAVSNGAVSLEAVNPAEARKGAPAKTEAMFLSLELYDVFATLSGCKPTVSTEREENTKYGPFLDFVRDAFVVLEVEASAENMARIACREKSLRNR